MNAFLNQNFTAYLMLVIALLAAITDYQKGKIYNALTFPAIFLAFIFSVFFLNHSFLFSIYGFLLALIIFVSLFYLKVFGAGDGKLMMAFGAYLGHVQFFNFFLLTLIIASAGAVILLFKHKRFMIFIRQVKLFAQSVFLPGLAVQWPKLRADIKAPFGIAVFVAFVVLLGKGI